MPGLSNTLRVGGVNQFRKSYILMIIVYAYAELLPGGFWFSVVGASLHGLLGGTLF